MNVERLDKVDKLFLTKKNVEDILDFIEVVRSENVVPEFNFIFNEGCIIVDETSCHYYNIGSGGTIKFAFIEYDKKEVIFSGDLRFTSSSNSNKIDDFVIENLKSSLSKSKLSLSDSLMEEMKKRVFYSMQILMNVSIYIERNRETVRVEVEKKQISKKAKSNSQKQKSQKKRISLLKTKRIYVDSGVINDVKRGYNLVAESWSVVGHWRKLKDGRMIWVKPYVKGKSNKEIGSEYKL